MTGTALRQGLISEQTIKDALVSAKGDLFVAASYLSVSPRELDSYIRSSEDIQTFASSVAMVKRNVDYDRMSVEQFREQLEQVTLAYRVEAVEVIHQLATMGFDSAAMAEVKLKAAIQLAGKHNDTPQNTEQATVLAELNNLYQQNAPRVKSIRIAQIEYQSGD